MKKSDKKFYVTENGVKNDVGTRSGVANFVRTRLATAVPGTPISLTIDVEAVDKKEEPAPATEVPVVG